MSAAEHRDWLREYVKRWKSSAHPSRERFAAIADTLDALDSGVLLTQEEARAILDDLKYVDGQGAALSRALLRDRLGER